MTDDMTAEMTTEMTTAEAGTFAWRDWTEQTVAEVDGGSKLTEARVINTWTGAVRGEGTQRLVMVYRPDGTGTFCGMESVVGEIGGRSGSFVVEHSGTFGGTTVRGTFVVIPGSATGELGDVRGEGGYVCEFGTAAPGYHLTLHAHDEAAR